jgi:hypothetical protein
MVLRRIFVPKREKVAVRSFIMYTSSNIAKVIKSRNTRAGCSYVARTGAIRNVYKILVGEPEAKMLLGRLDVDERIILKLAIKKYVSGVWNGLIWPQDRVL